MFLVLSRVTHFADTSPSADEAADSAALARELLARLTRRQAQLHEIGLAGCDAYPSAELQLVTDILKRIHSTDSRVDSMMLELRERVLGKP
jgi:hypothetical protein